jgi:hypothetical protein
VRFVFRAAIAACIGLIPSLALAVNAVSAPQSVTTDELQRYIYQADYPTWCGQSGQLARDLRAKPTTDPKTMHAIMKANIAECANTSYAQSHPALWTTAVFGAASAALLAARHETGAQAMKDAEHAKKWSSDLVNFVHQPGPAMMGRPGANTTPSMYRTNAGRINRDAEALITALKSTASSTTAPNDNLPDDVPAPGATKH